ncbi:hypothetical protein JS562_54390 [Agrobacterium sp. S2]|nr:hypothetical protein [Agrobacterium sp. S2]
MAKIDANVSQAGVGGVSLPNSKDKRTFSEIKGHVAGLAASPLYGAFPAYADAFYRSDGHFRWRNFKIPPGHSSHAIKREGVPAI